MGAGVGIERNDQYQNLWTAHFHSRKAGVYEFGVEGPDDRATVWIDLDQDGVFETEGENGNEWINLGYGYNYREVELGEGYYLYAVSHREGGGGSRSTRAGVQSLVLALVVGCVPILLILLKMGFGFNTTL